MATVCPYCACTIVSEVCACSVCVVCAPAQEVVERSGQTVSCLCERSREETWAHQWLCLRDQHCIKPPLMLYQYLMQYVELPHHLCTMLFCIHYPLALPVLSTSMRVSIANWWATTQLLRVLTSKTFRPRRSLSTANLPLVSSWQRPQGQKVLLASTLNSCVVAHQFAISVSQRNYEPLPDHLWERTHLYWCLLSCWLLVGRPLHSLTANAIAALPCSSGYPH